MLASSCNPRSRQSDAVRQARRATSGRPTQLRRHEARCLVYTLPPAEPEQVPSKANRNGEERGGDTSASVAAYASMWSAGHSLLSYWALGLRILVPQTRNDADMSPCVPRHYIVLDHLSGTAYASCLRVWIAAPLYRWLRPPCYERSVSPVSAYRLAPLRPPCRRVKSQIRRFTGLARRWAYYWGSVWRRMRQYWMSETPILALESLMQASFSFAS